MEHQKSRKKRGGSDKKANVQETEVSLEDSNLEKGKNKVASASEKKADENPDNPNNTRPRWSDRKERSRSRDYDSENDHKHDEVRTETDGSPEKDDSEGGDVFNAVMGLNDDIDDDVNPALNLFLQERRPRKEIVSCVKGTFPITQPSVNWE